MTAYKMLQELLPQDVIDTHTSPKIWQAETLHPGYINWYDDGYFVNHVNQVYNAQRNGFCKVVTFNAVITCSFRGGEYTDVLFDASLEELLEGFPTNRLVLDYSELFIQRP